VTDTLNDSTDQDEPLAEPGLKALKSERDARKALERQLRETQAKVAEFERRDLVHEVATTKGLDPRFTDRLKGSTREELEGDADALLELIKPEPDARPPGLPKERLSGGGDPTEDAGPSAPQMADRIIQGN
jgi:hypothetical protein